MRSTTSEWFDTLHDAYFVDVRGFLQRRVRDRQLAEDLAQETFLRAYQSRDTFDAQRPAWPWLSAIARNLLINALRDDARRPEVIGAAPDGVPGTAETSHEAIPELSMHTGERWTLIRRSLAELSERERRVLLLRCERELAYVDIAEAEGLSVDAMKSLLKRARHRFRVAYVRHGGDLPAIIAGPLVFLRARRRALERWAPKLMNPAMATTEVVVAAFLVATSATGSATIAASTADRPSSAASAPERSHGAVAERQPTSAEFEDQSTNPRVEVKPPAPVTVALDTTASDEESRTIEIIHEDRRPGRSRGEGSKTKIQIPCLGGADDPVCGAISP